MEFKRTHVVSMVLEGVLIVLFFVLTLWSGIEPEARLLGVAALLTIIAWFTDWVQAFNANLAGDGMSAHRIVAYTIVGTLTYGMALAWMHADSEMLRFVPAASTEMKVFDLIMFLIAALCFGLMVFAARGYWRWRDPRGAYARYPRRRHGQAH